MKNNIDVRPVRKIDIVERVCISLFLLFGSLIGFGMLLKRGNNLLENVEKWLNTAMFVGLIVLSILFFVGGIVSLKILNDKWNEFNYNFKPDSVTNLTNAIDAFSEKLELSNQQTVRISSDVNVIKLGT